MVTDTSRHREEQDTGLDPTLKGIERQRNIPRPLQIDGGERSFFIARTPYSGAQTPDTWTKSIWAGVLQDQMMPHACA